jgi:tRNA dimethylallyltransferase
MLEHGALREVAGLLALGLSPELPVMRALGVASLARHLAGEIGLEEAAAAAKAETRKYAKRQLTWLRRNMIAWRMLAEQEMQSMDTSAFPFIDP